jgi:hypothetical protein
VAAFAQITKAIRAPGRTLLLEPWVFADEFEKKPDSAVCVGLRLMSESDKTKARAESERIAYEYHPNGGEIWIDAFEQALVRQIAALCICDPNNVAKPSSILPYAEEQVRFALTSRGAEHIFEAHRRYETEVSGIEFQADAEDASELADLLKATDVESLTPAKRRLIRYTLEQLSV